jgi:hypothetical protein
MASLGKMLTRLEVQHHIYADDVLLYFVLGDESGEKCQRVLNEVAAWMSASYLRVNPNKTQALLLHNSHTILPDLPQLVLENSPIIIHTEGAMRYLGINLDAQLTLSAHISATCKSAFYQLQVIRRLRPSLTKAITISLCNSLVLNRLDYCNFLVQGAKMQDTEKLQRVINASARVVFHAKRREHSSPLLRRLGWLDIRQRSRFRIANVLFKVMKYHSPVYLHDELQWYHPTRTLRSGSKNLLVPKYGKRKIGGLSFGVLSAGIWNELPEDLRLLDSKTTSFRNKLLQILS